MRALAFFAAGLGLLGVQMTLFRALDGLHVASALALLALAMAVDAWGTLRHLGGRGRPSVFTGFRVDVSLPALVLVAYALLAAVGHTVTRVPIPSLVLPLILFMGVHEYSLARGAGVAFALGYLTDVLGVAPVGLYTFTYVATYLLARAAGVRLAAQTSWMQVLLVGAFTVLQSTMLLVLLAIFGRDAWVPRALYPLALPHALATAAVAPGVFRLSQALHAATASTSASRAEAGSLGS